MFWRQSWRLWREQAGSYFWVACFIFVAFFAAGAGAAVSYPDLAENIFGIIAQNFADKGLLDAEPVAQAWIIFANNLTVSAFLLVFGFIPLLFLPYIIIGLNGLTAGLVIAAAPMPESGGRFLFAAAGLLPHGIFELPALFIAASLGSYCCACLTGGLMSKLRSKAAKPEKLRLGARETALFTVKIFLLLVLPLLFVAAVAEIWLTPLVMKAVL
ncbi:MAG: stage II sporulation protein M [Gracilibacteraceae bacterium]|jgi:stage II sporulation protein M|nr:stage II sporulation protein M [Gracilibacteraceae bacterium]